MNLDGIIGNHDAVRALKGMAESGRIPHAMMLYENDGCGAMALVLAFLSQIMGDEHKVCGLIHPDVHYVYPVANGSKVTEKVENLRAELFLEYWRSLMVSNPYALENEVSSAFGIEGKQSGINNAEAKEILETVWLTSVEGGWKAVVVYLPEKMNAASANRLLKAIEEPPEKTLFIITTYGMENASRCYTYKKVKKMVERQKEKYGWEFLFLGANMDAIEAAGNIGIHADRAATYQCDAEGTALNYEVLGEAIYHVRNCSEPLAPCWMRKIDEDVKRRGGRR